MKKALLLLLATVLAIAPIFSLVSCKKTIEFNVKFIVDGQVYKTVTTENGELPYLPDDPAKDGYTFGGWFWDDGVWQNPLTAASLADAPLSSSMSVYAKWVLTCAHVDANDDLACDLCQAPFDDGCSHVDENDNGTCDKCGDDYDDGCDNHVDADDNLECDICKKDYDDGCDNHVDADDNLECDICQKDYDDGKEDPCAEACAEIDKDKNCKCDNCNKKIPHKDTDNNGKCDSCSRQMEIADDFPTVEWIDDDPIELYFMMSKNTDGGQHPSGCERYLAGEDLTAMETIDDKVAMRNSDAYLITNVNLKYDYYDDVPEYGWGRCMDIIFTTVKAGGTNAPDMFANFSYDMIGASLKGSFVNLKNPNLDIGNYFSFLDPDYDESVNNRGYMYEYMESLSLSNHKMYILASDYFIDVMRSAYVIPVNVELLYMLGDSITGDLDEDGMFTLNDFYLDIENKGWTYKKLMDYSKAVFLNTGTANLGEDIEDRLGFAVCLGYASSALLYSTDITVINKEWSESEGDYTYSYPTEATELYDIFDSVDDLMNTPGIVCIDSQNSPEYKKYGYSVSSAIRARFCNNNILFGSVVTLSSLEYDAYQDFKTDSGLAIAPVPLYMEKPGEDDNYNTAIRNTARPGAIATSTRNFTACSAFLDYQSTHSGDILNEYFSHYYDYDITGEGFVASRMLKFIRKNIGATLAKTVEDAAGICYSANAHVNISYIMEINRFKYDIRKDYDELREVKARYLELLCKEYLGLPG